MIKSDGVPFMEAADISRTHRRFKDGGSNLFHEVPLTGKKEQG